MVDLDLLSCFSKVGQESLEGLRGIKLTKFTTMEKRGKVSSKGCFKPMGKKAPLNRFPEKSGRWAQIRAGPVVPPQGPVLPPPPKTAY